MLSACFQFCPFVVFCLPSVLSSIVSINVSMLANSVLHTQQMLPYHPSFTIPQYLPNVCATEAQLLMLTQETLDGLAPPDLSCPICHEQVPPAKPHYLYSLISLLRRLCRAVPQLRIHFSLDLISNLSLKFKTATFSFTGLVVFLPYSHVCMRSHFSPVRLFVTLWTIDGQAPLSMGFSKQEYWSGLSRPSPGDLPDPGIKPVSLKFPALAGGSSTTSTTWEAHACLQYHCSFP